MSFVSPASLVTPAEFTLTDKTAIVTGAGMGIGRAIAQQLAAFGAFVVILDIDRAAARDTLAAIEASGGRGAAFEVDLRDEVRLIASMRRAAEINDRLDILVNSAGIYPVAPFEDSSDDMWREVFDVNLRAAFVTMREAARLMGQGGAIINISSVDSLRPSFPGLSVYGATKAALNSLTRSGANELGPRGIRVNAVLPGVIATRGLPAGNPRYQVWADRAAARRVGEPFDIAGVVLFLASPLAQFIHGQTIVADGGVAFTA
jgi:NAD(P)-dependent dehydrogenase (short-subunit alcohol dehydrogenase family)